MVAENPTWGAPRIHGELLLLGFDVSKRTISRWMKKAPQEPARAKRCAEVYTKANDDFDAWLASHLYPRSTHAGIPDPSEMLYLGGDKDWVRNDLVATGLGDPPRKSGEHRDPNANPLNNGISGDARPTLSGRTVGSRWQVIPGPTRDMLSERAN